MWKLVVYDDLIAQSHASALSYSEDIAIPILCFCKFPSDHISFDYLTRREIYLFDGISILICCRIGDFEVIAGTRDDTEFTKI